MPVAALPAPSVASPTPNGRPLVDDSSPTWRWLLACATAAVAVRMLLALLAALLYHHGLLDLATARDGRSYLHMAQALLGDSSQLSDFDRRVFVGYPALIAPLAVLGIPVYVAALLEAWLSAGVAAALAGRLFANRRVALACAFALPSSLLSTTIVYNEGPLIALMLAGLLASRRERTLVGGVLLGMAGAVRPVACFAVLGAMAVEVRRGRWQRALHIGGTAALVLAAETLAYRAWTGDALEGLKVYADNPAAYGGHMFALPFQTLVSTPFAAPTPLWKVAYIWGLAALVLVGNWLAIARVIDSERTGATADASLDRLAAVWLAGNTLFVLCIGKYWGFHEFHRFILPAFPPLIWAYRNVLPRAANTIGWTLIGAGSAAMAVFALRLN